MIQKRILVIFVLLSFSVLSPSGGSSSSDFVSIPESDIEVRWVQDGQSYVLADGDIYRDMGGGDYSFVVNYYDPDFFEKNYFVDGATVYRKFPDDEAKQIRLHNEYDDDFESYETFLDTMLTGDVVEGTEVFSDGASGRITTYDYKNISTRWSSLTLQSPGAPDVSDYVKLRRAIVHEGSDFIDNRVDLSDEEAHSGKQSLRFFSVAPGRSMVTAKSSIATESVFFRKGDEFRFSGWFYFEQGMPTTIMDLESTWLEGHSGIRILFSPDGTPYVELKAFHKPSLRSREFRIPRGRWVEVTSHILLDEVSGAVKLWIDGQKVIDGEMQTLPLTDTVLNSVEIGISATSEETVLFVDDVSISAGR